MTESWTQYGGLNRCFTMDKPLPAFQKTPVLWRRPLGEGTSGIVSEGPALYTLYSEGFDSTRQSGVEVIVSLEASSGKTRWEQRTPVSMLPKQESFTDDPIRPQSTPLLWQGCLLTLGFTGLLTCLDAASGRLLWRRNLVKEFGATPVQFGFSASPLIYNGLFIVHVGGKQGAVMAFEPSTGKRHWNSSPSEPAYASPVLVRVGAEDHLVQLTRDALLGISAADGSPRWSYPLPKQGQTNVPTPLVLPDQKLLISGQGVLGTRLLQLSGSTVREVWANNKVTYFYCNWAAHSELVMGCNSGGLMTGLHLRDGRELWRERGLNQANLLHSGEDALFLSGDGFLARARATTQRLEQAPGKRLLTGRCWTPPILLGKTLYARDNREIVAARLS